MYQLCMFFAAQSAGDVNIPLAEMIATDLVVLVGS